MKRLSSLMMRCMPMMVTCKEADEFIDAYLAGELAWKQRLIFEWHMGLCPGCRHYLKQYGRSIELCRENFYGGEESRAEAGETDQEIAKRLMDAVAAAKRSEKSE